MVLVRAFLQPVEVSQCAILRVHIFIVRNVIPEIHLRRRIHRRNPDRIHTQLLQVRQVRRDPVQIPHPIAIAVAKTARVNLIHKGVLPPRLVGGGLGRGGQIGGSIPRLPAQNGRAKQKGKKTGSGETHRTRENLHEGSGATIAGPFRLVQKVVLTA